MEVVEMLGTRVEIDLDALEFNYRGMRQLIPETVKVAGVIKANAYGHDLIQVGKSLETWGVDYLAVANVAEGLALRQHQVCIPILIMGKTFEADYLAAIEHHLTLTIFDTKDAERLNQYAQKNQSQAKVHLKLDTGFNRLGYPSKEAFIEAIKVILTYPYIEVEGVFSHLALKNEMTDALQFERFDSALTSLETDNILVPIKHICDSIGTIAYPNQLYDMVRWGSLLYGYCSRETPIKLKPVMRFITNISQVKTIEPGEGVSYDYTFVANRPTTIATLPVGYGDGLPRNLSNVGVVAIQNHLAPIIGIICMDQCIIDVTEIVENGGVVKAGDEVVLFGNEVLSLTTVAQLAKTNRNELLARITSRVPRIFTQRANEVSIRDESGYR